MSQAQPKFYASVFNTKEPTAIMIAPHFAPTVVHKELSVLNTDKGPGLDQHKPIILWLLAKF